MKKTINISTGQVKMGTIDDILVSNGIGSCIVLVAINIKKLIGAMAHIMLPGKAPSKEIKDKTKYAEDAMTKLLHLLQFDIHDLSNFKICLAGGANVLKKHDDTICDDNIKSVLSILNKYNLKIDASSLGGTLHRSIKFDIEKKEVYLREGDLKAKLLISWE